MNSRLSILWAACPFCAKITADIVITKMVTPNANLYAGFKYFIVSRAFFVSIMKYTVYKHRSIIDITDSIVYILLSSIAFC